MSWLFDHFVLNSRVFVGLNPIALFRLRMTDRGEGTPNGNLLIEKPSPRPHLDGVGKPNQTAKLSFEGRPRPARENRRVHGIRAKCPWPSWLLAKFEDGKQAPQALRKPGSRMAEFENRAASRGRKDGRGLREVLHRARGPERPPCRPQMKQFPSPPPSSRAHPSPRLARRHPQAPPDRQGPSQAAQLAASSPRRSVTRSSRSPPGTAAHVGPKPRAWSS